MGNKIQNIYIWANKVRPVTPAPWWQPDPSRTLLYLKFNNNLNDDSGNNRTVTGNWFGYWVIGNNYYVEKTATSYSSTYINPSPASMNTVIGSGDFTVSLFFFNKTHTSSSPMLFWEWQNSNPPFHWIYILANGDETIWMYTTNNDFHANPQMVASFESWHHLVFTRISWVCYRYIDWAFIDSYSNSIDFNTYPWDTFFLLNRSTYSWHSWANVTWWKISEVIFEKVWWSNDEVATYFSQQKANYWL